MSKKFWRPLAACIAIECAAWGAAPEYRAGAARSEHVRAVVVEDRRGFRVVFAQADFPITRAMSDFVAVELLKAANIDRTGVVLNGAGPAGAGAPEIVGTIAQALSKLEPSTVSFAGVISLRSADGSCVATLYPVQLAGCRDGVASHGRIRAAFRMFDVPHPLQTRATESRTYPVQAVAIGKAATVLALGGEVPPGRFAAPGRIVVPFANDTGAMPEGIDAVVADVLKRVR